MIWLNFTASGIIAISTVVLVIVTWRYVRFTGELVKSTKQTRNLSSSTSG